jgi:hypothetical protein
MTGGVPRVWAGESGDEAGVGGHLKTRAGPVFAEWETRRRAMRDSIPLSR